ncbi:hypothetical protein J6590_033729 [Homalodisca vitripennis]|nr:hypothetical protein J6590_033729 [Homalodisca vitripennis]
MQPEKSGPVVTPAASSSCGDTEHSQRCCTYAIREVRTTAVVTLNILRSVARMQPEKSGPVVTPAASSSCGDTEHSQRCCTYAIREVRTSYNTCCQKQL